MKAEQTATPPGRIGGAYAWYVLGVLFIVYALNFIDRQILSILAEDIKLRLDLTDTQLGYLYGTAFALFYALFGIPLGRLADSWYRVRLMSIGLAVWSAMTAASGLAGTFAQLATCRVGVGVGEAAASPAAFSLLADYFPARRRALALAIYSAGLYLGMGLSLPIGGWLSSTWDRTYPGGNAPFALAGWQATFVAIGVPGILIALWVWTLREPQRGIADGRIAPLVQPGVWTNFGTELASIVPPFTIWTVARFGAGLARNLQVLVLIGAIAALLVWATGDAAQWICYGIGIYAVFSWTQVLRMRDRPSYELIWGTPTVILAICGFGSLSFFSYAYGFWTAPFAIRTFHVSKELVGLTIGIPAALASATGAIVGGRLSDAWKARDPRGRIFVCMLSMVLPGPFFAFLFSVQSYTTYCVLAACVSLLSTIWIGSTIAAYQDFVLPRMRGTIGATYLLGSAMVGLALGPYFTGKISTLTGSLRIGAYSLYAIAPVSLVLLWIVSRRIAELEASKFARAQAAGEAIA